MTHSQRLPSSSESPERLLISVRVQPRASRAEVTREGNGLRVHVTAPPVDGAANEALVALLSQRLGLPKRAVTVLRGAAARNKVVAVTGLAAEELWTRLGL